MFITHIHSYSNPIKKTFHYAINVTTTKAELFAIKCGINQAVQILDIFHIIVITNSIYSAQHIFNLSVHPYQLQSITIAKDLKMFFNKQSTNSIEFWDCPSDSKWSHHVLVDKDIKKFNLTPISPSKVLWDFDKKEESNNIIKNWHMTFQTSDLKGNYFLDLLDNNLCIIKPSYIKEGPWIKHFGHSNLLCARAT